MRINFSVELPEVEVETDTNHGSIDFVWFDGEDVSDWTVSRLVQEFLGTEGLRDALLAGEQALRLAGKWRS